MFDESEVRAQILELCKRRGATRGAVASKPQLIEALGAADGDEALGILQELLPPDVTNHPLRVLRRTLNFEGHNNTAVDRRTSWGTSENTAKSYEREGAELLVALIRQRLDRVAPAARPPHQIQLDDLYRPRRPVLRFEGRVLANVDADLVCRSAYVKTRLVESEFLDGWPWPGSKDEWWEGESPAGRLRLATSRKFDELKLEVTWKQPPDLLFVQQDNAPTASVNGQVERRTELVFRNVAMEVRLFALVHPKQDAGDLSASLAEHNRKIAARDRFEAALKSFEEERARRKIERDT